MHSTALQHIIADAKHSTPAVIESSKQQHQEACVHV